MSINYLCKRKLICFQTFPELTFARLTYEVRMGYQDKFRDGNQDSYANTTPTEEDNWTKLIETTQFRKLRCYLQPDGVSYGLQTIRVAHCKEKSQFSKVLLRNFCP